MSGVTMTGIAIGMGASMLMNTLTQDGASGAQSTPTPPPATPAPTQMAPTPQSQQKKTEQTAAMATAGRLTPQATLLSGNEKRSVLGG